MFFKNKTKKNLNESESVEETGKPSEKTVIKLTDDDMDKVTGGVSLQHIKNTLDM